MTSCYLAKTQSRVKGHHVYKYAYKTGVKTNDFIENDNKYSILYCEVYIYCYALWSTVNAIPIPI